MNIRGRPKKHLLFLSVSENADVNEIALAAENENESHLIILVVFFLFLFHTFSHQVNPTAANTSSSFAFFADGPC